MIGTLINAAAVIVGSLLGLLLRKGIPQQLKDTLISGMGRSRSSILPGST